MNRLLLLTFAASLAACHSRNDDQAAAAPAPGDSTATTHQVDPARTGPPGTGGRPTNGTVNVDSIGIDTTGVRVDTASTSPSPVSVPQDTLGPRSPDSTSADTARSKP
jgi:hypothetical protein